jgi:hypothetical protein
LTITGIDSPQDEPGAQERFDRALGVALKTPPKPHAAPKAKALPKDDKR